MTPFGKRDDARRDDPRHEGPEARRREEREIDEATPKPRPGPPVPPEPTPKPLPRPRPHGSAEGEDAARAHDDEARRESRGMPAPRTSEVRPLVLRCSVCAQELANVLVDVSVPEPILMPPHAFRPGYKCFGSGVEAVKLGRGDVIPQTAIAALAERTVAAEVPGQWGVR